MFQILRKLMLLIMNQEIYLMKYIIINILLLASQVKISFSGANNLHLSDGVSTAEILGGDVFFEITDPEELEYTYRIRPAKDFGAPFNSTFAVHGARLVPVQPIYGCTVPKNAEEIEGSVALVERGLCSFKSKTIIAENMGARAVIITDESITSDEYFIEMVDDESNLDANIPAGFLLGKNGYMIRKTLKKLNLNYATINLPVNLTFTPIHEIHQPPWLEW